MISRSSLLLAGGFWSCLPATTLSCGQPVLLPRAVRRFSSRYTLCSGPATSMASSTILNPTSFDVVVFGATSFTGCLVVEYYLKNYGATPSSFKWAIAARSEEKLNALKERLNSEVDSGASTLPTIIADSMDEDSLRTMVLQTKVVITTVGPYNKYGEKLVAACARAGVHCCDLTGESHWVRSMIDKYHAEAEETGAKIVPSCGFDSIPADMGTFMMVDHVKRTYGVSPDYVRYFLGKSKGGVSGGTIASVLDVVGQMWSGGSAVGKKINDPLLLAPPKSDESAPFKNPGSITGMGYDSSAKAWTAPIPTASPDSKVVYRSGSIVGYPSDFRYKEVASFKGLVKGFFPALLTTTVMTIGGLLLFFPPTRKLMMKLLPAPGGGPSKEVRDNGCFWIKYVASAKSGDKEIVCHGKAGSDDGDGGYKETAKMLAECGLCLALDENKIERKSGGVLTTASAMGLPLLERLRRAHMTFEVSLDMERIIS